MHCYSTSICLQCSVKWEEIFFSTSLRCHLLLQCKSLQWVFSGNAVRVLSGQSKMCILANTGRHPPSVFINKVTGLAEYWSLAKTLLTQHFNCFAAASAATAGLLSRMEECFGAKQKFSIRSFLHTGKLWGWGVTMTTPNAQPTLRYLWMRTAILWFGAFLVTWVTKYILFVQDPVLGQFGANLAVKTLGHQTCIGCSPDARTTLRNPLSLLCYCCNLQPGHFLLWIKCNFPCNLILGLGALSCI